MSPQPSVDQDRKEELILAKQLRACRVTILPKASGESESLPTTPNTGSPSSPSRTYGDTFFSPFKPVPLFHEEEDKTDWELLRITDPSNPPWTSSVPSSRTQTTMAQTTMYSSDLSTRTQTTMDSSDQSTRTQTTIDSSDLSTRTQTTIDNQIYSGSRGISRETTPSMVTKVPDIRKKVGPAPSISITDVDSGSHSSFPSEDSLNSMFSPPPSPRGSLFSPPSSPRGSLFSPPSSPRGSISQDNRMVRDQSSLSRDPDLSIITPLRPVQNAITISSSESSKNPLDSPPEFTSQRDLAPISSFTTKPLPFLAELQARRKSISVPPTNSPSLRRACMESLESTSENSSNPNLTFNTNTEGAAGSSQPAMIPNESAKAKAIPTDVSNGQSYDSSSSLGTKQRCPSLVRDNSTEVYNSPVTSTLISIFPSKSTSSSTVAIDSTASTDVTSSTTSPADADPTTSTAARGSTSSTRVLSIKGSAQSPSILRKSSVKTRSPSPKSVHFNLPVGKDEFVESQSELECEATKPPKCKKLVKSGPLKINEKTNMSQLANSIIPQLNEMQKNFLGLLFFNELSPRIVRDLISQQLSGMAGAEIRDVLSAVEPQARESASRVLMEEAHPSARAALVVDSLATMEPVELAETILNIAGQESIDTVRCMCELAGRRFKLSLLQALVQHENFQLVPTRPDKAGQEEPRMGSDGGDEVFDSCEESYTETPEDM